jgi:hypothetical protein
MNLSELFSYQDSFVEEQPVTDLSGSTVELH